MGTPLSADDENVVRTLLASALEDEASPHLPLAEPEMALLQAEMIPMEVALADGREPITPELEVSTQEPVAGQIRLFIAEEQSIMREAYESFFVSDPGICVLGTAGSIDGASLVATAMALKPHVLVLGTRVLQAGIMETLEMIREYDREIGIVLLTTSYDFRCIKALREYSKGVSAGFAFLQRHTVDTSEQLVQVVQGVAQGRVIVDPAVMGQLMNASQIRGTVLQRLTPREREVLAWMAKSYRNEGIANELYLEPKTVERHINNIYSKLDMCPDIKHPRVHAVIQYLEAVGRLVRER